MRHVALLLTACGLLAACTAADQPAPPAGDDERDAAAAPADPADDDAAPAEDEPGGPADVAGLVGGIDPEDRRAAVAAAEDFDPFDHDVGDGDAPPWPWELHQEGVDVPAMVPLEDIRSGGPPPNGIPPIDEPVFESVDDADEWLEPQEPVMVVEHGGEVRAYPLGILTFHEIVNDEVGGDPLLVTYCPLCNSGLVFERTVDEAVLDFGTSGRLWHSNLVMYDRATRSLWSQFTGEAIVGVHAGEVLPRLPMQMVAFGDLSAEWPQAAVLSRDTGHNRPYGENPYTGYDGADRPFLFDGDTGGPLKQMDRVVTAGGDDDPVAYPLATLREERVVHDDIAGEPAVVLWTPGTASALDTRAIAEGDDVGATGVFRAEVDGEPLTFAPADDDRFVDEQTGSTWTVLGEAVDGPLAGERLARLTHDDTFWFVQFAFRPDTRVER